MLPLSSPPQQDLKFGTVFTDHMFHVEHAAGQGWGAPAVKPLGLLQLHPASQVRAAGAGPRRGGGWGQQALAEVLLLALLPLCCTHTLDTCPLVLPRPPPGTPDRCSTTGCVASRG